MDGASGAWLDREIAGCSFAGERLHKRLRKLLEQMGDAMGDSIPLACQDWANTPLLLARRLSPAPVLPALA
jgi:Transposase DNA-binding